MKNTNAHTSRFDIAICNPPYCGELHLRIIERMLSFCSDIINISPCTWAAAHNINMPKGRWRKKFEGKIKSFELIEHRESNDLFCLGNAIENLAIMHFVQSRGDFDIMSYGFKNETEKSIFNKIKIYDKTREVMTFSYAATKDEYGSSNGSLWGQPNRFARKEFDVPVYQWHRSENCYDAIVMSEERAKKKVSMTMRFDNEKQKQNFLDSLKTTFMNYYYKKFIEPGDCKLVNYAFRMKDYTQPWTDERFRDYFNITDEEWKEIEGTVNEICKNSAL